MEFWLILILRDDPAAYMKFDDWHLGPDPQLLANLPYSRSCESRGPSLHIPNGLDFAAVAPSTPEHDIRPHAPIQHQNGTTTMANSMSAGGSSALAGNENVQQRMAQFISDNVEMITRKYLEREASGQKADR